MSSNEEVLHTALAAHLAGNLAIAEVGYRKILRQRPNDHQALYGLGVINFEAGAREIGIDLLLRCLQSAPDSGVAWNALGSMYVETGRPFEGKLAYQRATEVSPELSEAWYGLAGCSIRDKDLEAAVQHLRRALTCPKPYAKVQELLATTLDELRESGRDATELPSA